ncbi:hypothetical protein HAX54_000092, partial [Datura stramonium]|nr:hypothetical protein [Datura stramonium]
RLKETLVAILTPPPRAVKTKDIYRLHPRFRRKLSITPHDDVYLMQIEDHNEPRTVNLQPLVFI